MQPDQPFASAPTAPPYPPYQGALLQPGMPGPLYLEPPNSSLALSSLIFGIVGIIVLPLIGSIIAVVLGHMARNEIRQSRGLLRGDGMALAGLILGYIGIAISVLTVLFIIGIFVVTLNHSGATTY